MTEDKWKEREERMKREDLRDRFAMAALTGLLHPLWEANSMDAPAKAYELADAMLEARK